MKSAYRATGRYSFIFKKNLFCLFCFYCERSLQLESTDTCELYQNVEREPMEIGNYRNP